MIAQLGQTSSLVVGAAKRSLIAPKALDPQRLQKAHLIVLDDLSAEGLRTAAQQLAGGQTGTRKALTCQFNPAQLTFRKTLAWTSRAGSSDGDDGYDKFGSWEAESRYSGDDTVFYKSRKFPETWRNTPLLKFAGGMPATFGLELFFDSSEENGNNRDVRRYSQDLLALALGEKESGSTSNKVSEPPTVMFVWGKMVLFAAVVESVQVSYILFDPDGTPLRAKARVGFVQREQLDNDWQWQNPTTRTEPRRTRIVQAGESLHQIAYEEYDHPAHWRHIAEWNNLQNPLELRPGQVLILPPLP